MVDDPATGGEGLAPIVGARGAVARRSKSSRSTACRTRPPACAPLADRVERSSADCLFVGAGADRRGRRRAARRSCTTRVRRCASSAPTALDRRGPARRLSPAVEDQLRITTPTLPPQAWPRPAQRFFRAFAQRYGRAPAPDAIFGYEAMMRGPPRDRRGRRARQPSRRGVKQFFAIRDRRSVLGTYDIDDAGRHHAVARSASTACARAGSCSTESCARSSANRLVRMVH